MKSFTLVEYKKDKGATIYSILYHGETESETRKFFSKFSRTHLIDVQEMLALIESAVKKRGLSDNHCRSGEGSIKDSIVAMPGRPKDTEQVLGYSKSTPELRLYGLRLTKNIIILYTGGVKPEGKIKYQDVPVLYKAVKDLQEIEKLLLERINDLPFPELKYDGNTLKGNLVFELD